jgi:hypothetical protein
VLLVGLAQVNQLREYQTHVPPFVHYGRAAMLAIDFGRHLVFSGLFMGRVEHQRVDAPRKSNIGLVVNRTPLKGGGYNRPSIIRCLLN